MLVNRSNYYAPYFTKKAVRGASTAAEKQTFMARYRKILTKFVGDDTRQITKLPKKLNSHERRLVHTLAEEFDLHHAGTGWHWPHNRRRVCIWKDGCSGPSAPAPAPSRQASDEPRSRGRCDKRKTGDRNAPGGGGGGVVGSAVAATPTTFNHDRLRNVRRRVTLTVNVEGEHTERCPSLEMHIGRGTGSWLLAMHSDKHPPTTFTLEEWETVRSRLRHTSSRRAESARATSPPAPTKAEIQAAHKIALAMRVLQEFYGSNPVTVGIKGNLVAEHFASGRASFAGSRSSAAGLKGTDPLSAHINALKHGGVGLDAGIIEHLHTLRRLGNRARHPDTPPFTAPDKPRVAAAVFAVAAHVDAALHGHAAAGCALAGDRAARDMYSERRRAPSGDTMHTDAHPPTAFTASEWDGAASTLASLRTHLRPQGRAARGIAAGMRALQEGYATSFTEVGLAGVHVAELFARGPTSFMQAPPAPSRRSVSLLGRARRQHMLLTLPCTVATRVAS